MRSTSLNQASGSQKTKGEGGGAPHRLALGGPRKSVFLGKKGKKPRLKWIRFNQREKENINPIPTMQFEVRGLRGRRTRAVKPKTWGLWLVGFFGLGEGGGGGGGVWGGGLVCWGGVFFWGGGGVWGFLGFGGLGFCGCWGVGVGFFLCFGVCFVCFGCFCLGVGVVFFFWGGGFGGGGLGCFFVFFWFL